MLTSISMQSRQPPPPGGAAWLGSSAGSADEPKSITLLGSRRRLIGNGGHSFHQCGRAFRTDVGHHAASPRRDELATFSFDQKMIRRRQSEQHH